MPEPLLPELPGYDNPQLIAHGTSALVFRATQTTVNRLVAIKVITADTGSIPVNPARELATTVALSSQPHIVSIIDTGTTDDGQPYIVMEYCEGGSYAQILRRGGPLPVADVLEVGINIGEALHAAHQAGIVHRDVKPSNILRSRFGPALTDFGIARAPDELGSTLTREMMTPHHASPEALLHQAQSGLSDVYSLASTLWTLLVGHPPFVDPTRPAVDMYLFRDRVLNDPVPPMERADVPAWLVSDMRRAMAKLPADRHASAAAFAEALRRGVLGIAAPEAATTPTTTARPVIPVGSPWSTSGTPLARSGATPPGSSGAMVAAASVEAPAAAAEPNTARAAVAPPRAPAASATPPAPSRWLPAPASSPTSAQPEPAGPAPSAGQPPPLGMSPAAVRRPVIPPATPAPKVVEPSVSSIPAWLVGSPATPPSPPATAPGSSRAPGVSGIPVRFAPGDPPVPTILTPPEEMSNVDEGGWLPPSHFAAPPVMEISAPLAPSPAARRFAGEDPERRTGPRTGLIVGLAIVTVIAIAAVMVITLFSNRAAREANTQAQVRASASASAPPSTPAPTAVGGPPARVQLMDRGTSITLSWVDPAGGQVSFLIGGTDPAGKPLLAKQVPQGQTTVTYDGVSAKGRYCFVVGAIYTVTDVARAPQVCTKR
jgi:serine/threonine protein kinase